MKLAFKHAIAAILLMLSLAAPIAAGPLPEAEKAEAKKDSPAAEEMFRHDPGLWEFQTQVRNKLSFGPGDKFWKGDRADGQPVVQSSPSTGQMCIDEKSDIFQQQEQEWKLKHNCEPTNWKKDGEKFSSKTVCKESDATYTGTITYEQTYRGSKSNYRGESRTTYNPPGPDGTAEFSITVLTAKRLGLCKPGQKHGDVFSMGPTPGESKPPDMESGSSKGQVRKLPTVNGPEATDLDKKTVGCVVMGRSPGIVAIEISTKDEIVLRPGIPDFVGGLDEDGLFAFVEDQPASSRPDLEKSFSLKVGRIGETTEQVVFSRQGSALWDAAISAPVLSPRGGRIAFISQPPESRREFAPPIRSGPLEVWNIATKSGGPIGVTAQNNGISWFPDGKRLAYVGALGADAGMVIVLNVETNEQRQLVKGSNPLVSPDGNSVLIKAVSVPYALFNLRTDTLTKVELRGDWRGPIALLDEGIVLYWGLPTTGTAPRLTEHNSPFVGPKPMGTIKLAEIKSGKFQTIVPYVDPRTRASFGLCRGLGESEGHRP